MKICHECGALVDVFIKKEKQALNVKGTIKEVELKTTHCIKCGSEVFNRELEIENDNKILKEIENEQV